MLESSYWHFTVFCSNLSVTSWHKSIYKTIVCVKELKYCGYSRKFFALRPESKSPLSALQLVLRLRHVATKINVILSKEALILACDSRLRPRLSFVARGTLRPRFRIWGIQKLPQPFYWVNRLNRCYLVGYLLSSETHPSSYYFFKSGEKSIMSSFMTLVPITNAIMTQIFPQIYPLSFCIYQLIDICV